MAPTRIVTLTPNGVGAKAQWSVVGAASHQAATSDGSDSSWIEETTNGELTEFDLTTYTLQAGEFVSGVRMRVRAETPAGHTIIVNPQTGGSLTTLGGLPGYTIPASQSLQDFTTWMFPGSGNPFAANAADRGALTQSMVDGLRAVITLSSSQAGTSKVYEVAVDLYISDKGPTVVRNGSTLELSTGPPFRGWGEQIVDGWLTDTVANLKQRLAGQQTNVGENLTRLHVKTAEIKSQAGDNGWNGGNLAKLVELLQWMNDQGMYADLTLNARYHDEDNPSWLENLTEAQTWDERRTVARKLTGMFHQHPAVAFYCLINEGVAPTSLQAHWRVGDATGSDPGPLFLENIVKDPAGRSKATIWADWLADILSATDGIRLVNTTCLVGVGHNDITPAQAVSGGMDVLLPHTYPFPDGAFRIDLDTFSAQARPIVIEEFFLDIFGQGGTSAEVAATYAHMFTRASGFLASALTWFPGAFHTPAQSDKMAGFFRHHANEYKTGAFPREPTLVAYQISGKGHTPAHWTTSTDETFRLSGRVLLNVRNNSGSPVTVTVVTPKTDTIGNQVDDTTVSVPAGETRMIGSFPKTDFADPSDRLAHITFSATTNVTVATVKV